MCRNCCYPMFIVEEIIFEENLSVYSFFWHCTLGSAAHFFFSILCNWEGLNWNKHRSPGFGDNSNGGERSRWIARKKCALASECILSPVGSASVSCHETRRQEGECSHHWWTGKHSSRHFCLENNNSKSYDLGIFAFVQKIKDCEGIPVCVAIRLTITFHVSHQERRGIKNSFLLLVTK